MATPRPSFTKRQRENAKRERQLVKAAKRAARKNAIEQGVDPDLETDVQPQGEGSE
jgi:hypothetical protein